MIRRQRGELVAECDGCGAEFPGGCQDDFREFIQDIKDAGWRIVRGEDEDGEGNGSWEHYCEDCA